MHKLERGMRSPIAFRHRRRRPLRTTLDCAWIRAKRPSALNQSRHVS